jgi:3-oxoadipate enol-lactonase
MSLFDLSNNDALFYLYTPPVGVKPTVVFINALVGQTEMWEGHIGETLRDEGYGTLSYNFRGQVGSKFNIAVELTPKLIVDDLLSLMNGIEPLNPVLVGLSIGGLFAAEAIQRGLVVDGLVLINTLRRPGLRLDWINESTARAFALGGRQLLMDLMAPMLINPEKLSEMRVDALALGNYSSISTEDGHMNLMRNAVSANWDFQWSNIKLPTLVMTGFHDRIFLVEDDVAQLSNMMTNTIRVNFDNAGHLIPMERPEEFTKALLKFLKSY